jgi:hypothetical protein
MTDVSQKLARLVFDTRYRRRAIPGVFPAYEQDPAAYATDVRFKKWARLAGFLGAKLDLLAALCGTDKFGMHYYTPVYEALMGPHRGRLISLIELGVGGYANTVGGESLMMWAAYFRKGRIYGVDIEDKTRLSEGRIKVFQCSQVDRDGLTRLCADIGPCDFIIDDGSHINAHQIESFRILWPFVRDGGCYIVEDVQTSYWPSYGGASIGSPGHQDSCMTYFKSLADSVNAAEFLTPPQVEVDRTIGSIAFHHNLIVITKDVRVRSSNMPLEIEALRSALMTPMDSEARQ